MRSVGSPLDGFGSPFGTRRGFSPASLFAGGTEGAWYDPSDLTTLFQDAAGTTPVTASGQPVGLMLDKSGNGNHAVQATSAKRPTYTAGSGLHWLAFDGVDDAIVTGDVDFTGTDKVSVFAGLQANVLTNAISMVAIHNSTGFNAFSLRAGSGANGTIGFSASSNTEISNATESGLSVPLLAVTSGTSDLASPVTTLRRNGVVRTTNVGPVGGGNFAASALTIGSDSGMLRRFFYGNLYGLIIPGKLASPAEIASTEAYLAAKTGVTL